MAQLTIVANIKANADKVDLVNAELLKLIDITRAEAGCINYDLHQDNENPAHFLFFENWETRDLWQAHMGGQHGEPMAGIYNFLYLKFRTWTAIFFPGNFFR